MEDFLAVVSFILVVLAAWLACGHGEQIDSAVDRWLDGQCECGGAE